MSNGRALPTALLFDWLLGRAWTMAQNSEANAYRFSATNLGGGEHGAGLSTGGGGSGIEKFLTQYAGDEPAAWVTAHDRALEGEMAEVAKRWATEFQGIISIAVPTGPGFANAVAWLRRVTNGGDGLGYLGRDHRDAQIDQQAARIANGLNPRALPMPAGAAQAQSATAAVGAALFVARAKAQMDADQIAEAHKLRIDAVEALIRARNAAMDAAMEYTFTQMHLMFDVFGRNNNFLTKLQRDEQAMRARMEIRTAELAGWEARLQTTDDSYQGAIQKTKASVDRANTIDGMSVDANIRLLRRYSSRAASALNSAGVSVQSSASESNNINAGA